MKNLFKGITDISAKAILLLTLLAFSFTVRSQSITQASNSDVSFTSASSVRDINCDMLSCPGLAGPLVAIAYDDASGGGSVNAYFDVLYNGTSLTGGSLITLPSNTSAPDIVLGHNLALGKFYAAVVYVSGSDVYYDLYDVDPSGSPAVLQVNGFPVQLNTGTAGSPHIDLYADETPANTISTSTTDSVPTMHEFAIVWHEFNGSNFDVMLLTDDFSSGTVLNSPAFVQAGVFPDVAAYWDISGTYGAGPQKFAAVIYRTNNSSSGHDLWVDEYRVGFSAIGTDILENAGGIDIFNPRIESHSFIDLNSNGEAVWVAVASVATTGMSNFDYKQYYHTPNSDGDYSIGTGWFSNSYTYNKPAVATGPGQHCRLTKSGPSYLVNAASSMNNEFVGYFYPSYDVSNYTHRIDPDGQFSSNAFNEVNLSSVGLSSPDVTALAVSSASNSGTEVLCAWFDGSDVKYKISNNYTGGSGFKLTGIQEVGNAGISVYPNPATDRLVIAGSKGGYTITDVAGRFMLSGSAAKQVDISSLSPGFYILNVTDNGQSTRIKFAKQ